MYTYIPSFFEFPFHLGHHKALIRVPCKFSFIRNTNLILRLEEIFFQEWPPGGNWEWVGIFRMERKEQFLKQSRVKEMIKGFLKKGLILKAQGNQVLSQDRV